MHFSRISLLALVGFAAAAPTSSSGDDNSVTCSNSQSTMCCDKSGKNCEVKDSCSNDALIVCGNTVDVSPSIDILKRTGGGDDNSVTCSNGQSTVCCDKSGKNCEVKDSCSNDATIVCGNSVDLSGLSLTKRTSSGDDNSVTCSNSQSTVCCDNSGKNCEVKDSCSNDATIICGNTVDISPAIDILKRNDGDDNSVTCSNSQSTVCCDNSGKNCEVKDSCSNTATLFCGNTIIS